MSQFNGPFHTLSTYLPKLTLPIFGQNGVGWRIPVVAFGLLACWIIYYFIKTLTNSVKVAGLGAALTLLNPFLNHYAHDSRSYIMLLFFSTCSYLCLFKLLGGAWNRKYWGVLFLLFLLSYMATISAVVFLFIFMSSLWVLKILYHFTPIKKNINSLINIEFSHLVVFSIFSSLFFVCLVFYFDYSAFSVGQSYQGNRSANLVAIPDFFSAFLGYKYLDDVTSAIYHYSVEIYGVSAFCFAVGFICFFREKQIHTYFFITLFLSTAGFYIFSGSHIYTRTGVFLIPFLIFYQAKGVMFLTEAILYRLFHREQAMNICCWVLSGVVLFYCATFNFGKYRTLEPDSGNPYELTRNYLKNNAGPNDLIISSLYDTVGGFYLGDMIREKNYNIYKNGKIDDIYYLAPKADESKIELELVYPANKKVKFLPLDKFKPAVSFQNKGVRPSEVHVLKSKVEISSLMSINQQDLLKIVFTNKDKKPCNSKIDGRGIRLNCGRAGMSCAAQLLVNPNIEKKDLQIILFDHVNDKGADAISYASLKSLDQSFITGENVKKQLDPFPYVYMVNHLVNNIDDTDGFNRNVNLMDVTFQKLGNGKNLLLCMKGDMFQYNSLINGMRIFNWKQGPPEFN